MPTAYSYSHSSPSSRLRILFQIAFIFTMGLSNSKSFPLTKKSTPQDVLNYLTNEQKFAPYVKTGGTAIVTGGNSGIGVHTVEYLAKAGMNVVLCTRNVDTTEKNVKSQWSSNIQKMVHVQHLDLADLDTVRQTAKDILQKYDRIDCIVNNAGIMALPERRETKQGIEMQFGTNHVGHHFFNRLLVPRMNTQGGRIVCVSSTAHKMAPSTDPSSDYDWESKESYTPWGAYGRSKLANLLMAKSLAHDIFRSSSSSTTTTTTTTTTPTTTTTTKDHEETTSSMTAVSLHPGVIQSPLWKHTGWIGSIFGKLFADKDLEQGAATNVYCALVNQVTPGAWYTDCQPATSSTMGQDEQLRKQLWDYTENLLIEKGYQKDLPSLETVTEVAPEK